MSSIRSSTCRYPRACLARSVAAALGFAALLAFVSSTAQAAGTGWGTPLQLSQFSYPADSDPNGNPLSDGVARVAPHPDGAVTAVWGRAGSGILARTVGVGGSLGPTRVVAVENATLISALDTTPLGASRTLVSYVRRDGTRYRVKAEVIESSGVVGNELDLGSTTVGDNTPDYLSAAVLADNGDGTATAAWTVRSGDTYVVREQRIDDTGIAGPAHDLASLGSASSGELAIGGHGDGTASIAWYSARTSIGLDLITPQLVRVGSAGAIGSVRDVQPESSDPSYAGAAPQIAAQADGSTTVAWTLSASGGFLWQIAERVVAADGSMTPARNMVQPCTSQSDVYYCNSSYGGPPTIRVAPNGDGTTTLVSYGYGGAAYRIDRDGQPHGDGQVNTTGPWALDAGAASMSRLAGNGDGTATVVYRGYGYAFVSRRIDVNGASATAETIAQGADVNLSGFSVTRGSGTQVTATWVSLVPAEEWGAGRKTVAVFVAQRGVAEVPPAACPAVKLIGLRGSGEPAGEHDVNAGGAGLGKVVGALDKALHDNGVIDDFGTVPIPYPAAKFPFDDSNTTYDDSVRSGIDLLVAALSNDPCIRKSRYILAGYSQGAQVIGDAIEQGRLKGFKTRIIATSLFGDPKFDSDMTGVAFKSTFTNYPVPHGTISGRDNESLFVGYHARSFCRFRDVVCQRDIPRFVAGELREHEQYGGTEALWAAGLITNQILGQPPLRTTPEITAALVGDKIRVTCKLTGPGTCQMNVFPRFRWRGITGEVRPGTAEDKYRFIDHRSSGGVIEHMFDSPFSVYGANRQYRLTVRVKAVALQDGMREYHGNSSTTFNVP